MKPYVVKFEHLSLGRHDYSFEADKTIFRENEEILGARFDIELSLYKTGNMMNMDFHYSGEVKVPCDRCNDPIKIYIDDESKLVVKYGQVHHEDLDELIVLEDREHELDLEQYFYESLSLLIPQRRIHDLEECNPEILKKLNIDNTSGETDPRWGKLKEI